MITIVNRRQAADVLRHLRRGHGLSQLQLAERIFADQGTVSHRERGHNDIPIYALIDTARVFGFDLALMPSRHRGARLTGTGWPA